ncbi:MAG: hypothetical protein RR710_06490 [Oscillospiraceae bacterium]
MDIPKYDTSFKAWMPYTAITNSSSEQYKLQQKAITDEQGFRRIDDDYLVAMTTYYSEKCGVRFLITLENEVEFTVMVADIKNPDQTDKLNMFHPVCDKQGNILFANVLEFIIDKEVMNEDVLSLGTISSLGFEGQITKIERIDTILK